MWRKIGVIFISVIFWAVTALIFDIFVKGVEKLGGKVFSVLNAVVDATHEPFGMRKMNRAGVDELTK